MPEIKSLHTLRETPRSFTFLETQDAARNLRMQLRHEIDRLAILIQEVKKQGDKVLAVADAIGDRMLVEKFEDGAAKGRRSDVASLIRLESRKK